MGNAIFDDLEIDHSDMLSNPEGFAQRVYDAADKLKAICKSDTSTNAFMERYKTEGESQFPLMHFKLISIASTMMLTKLT